MSTGDQPGEIPQTLPLTQLRVVELQAIGPVPFCGMQLKQMGATVRRVLPPNGTPIGLQIGNKYDLLNRDKPVSHLDLKTPEGTEELHQRLAESDVLIEGFRPGVLERLNLAPTELLCRHPKLVIGRLSGYGRHGPYALQAGHDINYLALSGVLSAIGTPERPVIPLNLIADFGGGAMHLLAGILAKLVQRGLTGRGGLVDTSILAGTFGLTPMLHGLMASNRWNQVREGNLLDGGLPFYRVYATRDRKFVAVGALENRFFVQLLTLLGLESTIDVARQHDAATWEAMSQAFKAAFASRDRDDWAAAALDSDCCVTPLLDFQEACALQAHRDNGWIAESPFPHPSVVIDFDKHT
ncbi:MAG: CaiB/BaiF CoA-transferase family protein [Granulosicoccus sp.]